MTIHLNYRLTDVDPSTGHPYWVWIYLVGKGLALECQGRANVSRISDPSIIVHRTGQISSSRGVSINDYVWSLLHERTQQEMQHSYPHLVPVLCPSLLPTTKFKVIRRLTTV